VKEASALLSRRETAGEDSSTSAALERCGMRAVNHHPVTDAAPVTQRESSNAGLSTMRRKSLLAFSRSAAMFQSFRLQENLPV